ncbi:MAG TPA: hypothetical protein VFW77_01990 [Candidatus Saccharimonadales bacterium]|nr:hypothetical protein [Candidatus Saccharimonadales bacterium]
MKKLNNKGFGVVEAILILIIVGIIGGTGVYVYKQNQSDKDLGSGGNSQIQKTASDSQADKQTAQTPAAEDSNKGFLVIKEWGIKVKLRDSDKVTGYTYDSKPGDIFGYKYDSAVTPVIKLINAKNENCKTIGVYMYRTDKNYEGVTKKVGDHYFLVTGSPGQCADSTNDPDELANQRLVKDFVPANAEVL